LVKQRPFAKCEGKTTQLPAEKKKINKMPFTV
jgi:hypothetical protein